MSQGKASHSCCSKIYARNISKLDRIINISLFPEICSKLDGIYQKGWEINKLIETGNTLPYTLQYLLLVKT